MSEIVGLIKKCKKDIVCKLLGSEKFELSYSQLHKLSDEIFDVTNISISHSTLKRIFRDDYASSPQLTTLDAFAKYLGYTDWNEYFRANINISINSTESDSKPNKQRKKTLLFITIVIVLIGMAYFGYQKNFFIEPNYDNIKFSISDFDVNEMPVVVHFNYNLENIKGKEAHIEPLSVFGWRNPDKIKLNLNDTTARYIYQWYSNYTPLLIVDGEIVKQLNIGLKTHIWKAFISNGKTGYYIKFFDDKEIYTNGNMAFTEEVLTRNNFPKDDIEKVGYCLYKDFDSISGDSLHFKIQFRNTPLTRNEKSGSVSLALMFENTVIGIPTRPMNAPFYEFSLLPFENALSSQKADLSFLYLNLEEWNTIEIKTTGKNFNLYINDSLKFQTQYKADPGNLTGILFEAGGMGEVDYVKFFNQDGDLIYNNDFN